MKFTTLAWICLLFLALAVVAQDVSSFINPPASPGISSTDFSNDPVYPMDDLIHVQWNASFVNVTVLLEQYDNNFRPVLSQNLPNPGSMNWTVSYNDFIGQANLNNNTMMRFLLFDAPSQNHIYSHFFNLTSPPPASDVTPPQTTASVVYVNQVATSAPSTSTTIAQSASATTTPLSGTVSTTTTHSQFNAAAASFTSTSTTSPTATPGLTSSTQAGLGVGLGLGLPIIALLTAVLIIMYRRRSRAYQPRAQTWPPTQPPPYSQSPSSSHPGFGFASQPQIHAVPMLSAPPPARRFISNAHHPSNENGYAPPSALLKPWPGAGPLVGEKQGEYETRTYDAWGRPMMARGPAKTMSEVAGDEGRWGPSELGPGFGEVKELPALPSTPRQRPERPETLLGRYEGVIKGNEQWV